jgi:hypothetical protein
MKIAIQGHPIRGKEVIQILESLGGKNKKILIGTYKTFYYIDSDNEINNDCKEFLSPTYKLYTLEEFEKEFPFKVGDKVTHPLYDKPFTIIELNPTSEFPYVLQNKEAEFNAKSKILTKYKKKKTMETRTINLSLNKAKEWYKKGGELREIALQAFSEMELNPLPRSWEEFCKQGNPIASWRYDIPIKHEALFKLEQLRDCWRQGWKPNWNDEKEYKYCISNYQGKFKISILCETRYFLSFPTYEMAEEFLKCFRDLIEKAGDLI